jgi:hypothetical protein
MTITNYEPAVCVDITSLPACLAVKVSGKFAPVHGLKANWGGEVK